jgi:lysyl-tRNA synthetase class II
MKWDDPQLKSDILADAAGRIVGRVRARRVLTSKERAWATEFCLGLQKIKSHKGEMVMAMTAKERALATESLKTRTKSQPVKETEERCNMVFLAGIIKKIDVRDKYGWVLLDTGERGSIPFKCFEKAILADLQLFEIGDFIKIHGKLSQSKNKESDHYEMLVVLTNIKSKIPERSRNNNSRYQDEIPF